eukprot:scaffold56550_cov18-Tisochrysis_lutea.AAC.1
MERDGAAGWLEDDHLHRTEEFPTLCKRVDASRKVALQQTPLPTSQGLAVHTRLDGGGRQGYENTTIHFSLNRLPGAQFTE